VRLLLDTYTLLWAVDDPARLRPKALAELQNAGLL
jgi:PIN domain nuclease of toxin-antitoxin system